MQNGLLRIFKSQIKALTITYRHVLCRIPPEVWSWGGGTVLSLWYFQHRLSFDIDIFVRDPQYFSFLSPKWFMDETDAFDPDYSERADHIVLKTADGIRVDLLLAPVLADPPVRNTLPDTGFPFYVDTVKEIITAKLKYRRWDNKARDIFDIAVAFSKHPDLLKEIYDARALDIEDIIEWDTALRQSDQQMYEYEISMLYPEREYESLARNAPEMLREAIRLFRKNMWTQTGSALGD